MSASLAKRRFLQLRAEKPAATCRDPGSIIAFGNSGNKEYEVTAACDDVIGRPSHSPLGRSDKCQNRRRYSHWSALP